MKSETSPSIADESETPMPRLERFVLLGVFCVYIVVQVNAALHHGYCGQDFNWHTELAQKAAENPRVFIYDTYAKGSQEPPLYHLLCGGVYALTDGIHYLEVISLLQVALNLGAFALFYRLLRENIRSTVLRLACFIFMLFLPVSSTVAVVFASDGLAMPLFLTIVYFFSRLAKAQTLREYFIANGALTVLLLLGMFTKYTFVSVVAASAICLFVLTRVGVLSRKRLVFSLATVTLIPGVCAYYEFRACLMNPHFGISKTWVNPFTSPYMNVRSMVFPRRHDAHVLSAPPYFERNETPKQALPPEVLGTEGERWALLIRNKYSYPALLHLGIYTDVLNLFQGGHFTRSDTKAEWMALAVKTGLAFSLFSLVAVPIMLWRGLHASIFLADRSRGLLAVMSVLSLAWFCNIVGFFPFIPAAYDHGYWLPRLIAPALICFILLSFVWLDAFARRVGGVRWLCSLAVLFQSGLHIAFLWPWCVY